MAPHDVDDALRWEEMGGGVSAPPPRPDLTSLERDAQLSFAALLSAAAWMRTMWRNKVASRLSGGSSQRQVVP